MSTRQKAIICLLFCLITTGIVKADTASVNVIPKPVTTNQAPGVFLIRPYTVISLSPAGPDAAFAAEYLKNMVKLATGRYLAIKENARTNAIKFVLKNIGPDFGHEGYILEVKPGEITISANDKKGLLYGSVTLTQAIDTSTLANTGKPGLQYKIPALKIADYPRFPWRGLMLDCSRTFQSPDYLKKTIDRMAFYKLNTLHLHLTDDQGWRLEIKKYPQLTAEGARFADKYNEPDRHQGFYTQQQMKELIAYAKARNITIVPEIEMPGHTYAVLHCFPNLSCTGGSFEVFPYGPAGPGVTRDIFCAGNEQTFQLLTDVLTEVIELFDSEYIHIGGDEAPKDKWKKCPKCQKRITAQSLEDEHELQSYFIKRIERFINSKGRKLIGWDEILEGGLAPNAAVMSWRGTRGGVAAAKQGHKVVMSPNGWCYFDYTYTRINSMRVYDYEPQPDDLTDEQKSLILGVQANFWSHIDREPDLVDRQLFPRLQALAERAWSQRDVKDFSDFHWRQKVHRLWLDKFDVAYYREIIGIPAGSWSPETVSRQYIPMTWDFTQFLSDNATLHIRFHHTYDNFLRIRKVDLLADGKVISTDNHEGIAGRYNDKNEYTLALKNFNPDTKYEVIATAQAEKGLTSAGKLYLYLEQ